jgi:mRNA interferase MazF
VKPRPAVVIQDDRFDTDSVTVCPLTTDPTEAPLFRLEIAPSDANGLRESSRIMVDRITTVRCANMAHRVGVLDGADVLRLNRAIVVFLGMAGGS